MKRFCPLLVALAACSTGYLTDDWSAGDSSQIRGANGRAGSARANATANQTSPDDAVGDPPAAPCDPDETQRLEAAIRAAAPAGANAAVAVRTRCGVRAFTFGPSGIDADTPHRIGSISKTYVAALLVTLAREGALGLDDHVSRWLDGVPNGDRITIRQLLSHRSGLFNYNDDPKVADSNRSWQPEELLAVLERHAPLAAPGARFEYCNSGFLLAGLIAEAATGKRLSALIHERLLAPLGLTRTFFAPDDAEASDELAPSIAVNGDDLTHVTDASWAWGAGSMIATPADVTRWLEALATGKVLDEKGEAELLSPSPTDPPSSPTKYGLGVWLGPSDIGDLVWHRGDIPGYHSMASYATEHGITVFAVVDREAPSADVDEVVPLSNAAFLTLIQP